MRLTRGALFLLGFGLTLGVIWTGASVWTLIEERGNGNHLTKIERIVVGLNRARKAPARGGDALQPANAGQQPSPGQDAGHQETPGGTSAPHPQHPHAHEPKGGGGSEPVDEAVPPTSTGNSAGQAESTDQGAGQEAHPEEAARGGNPNPGVIGNPGGAVGKVTCAAGEVVKELAGVQVCSPE